MVYENDILWQIACNVDNIMLAAYGCFGYANPEQHVDRLKPQYREWYLDRKQRAESLRRRMERGYTFSEYREMHIEEPKPRVIHYHTDFEDNIAERAVLRAVEPCYMQAYSGNSFGSIKGRGLMKAGARLFEILKAHPDAYFIQADCRKYYNSIDHDILKAEIRRTIPSPGCCDFLCRLVDSFNPGIPIGIPSGHFNGNLMLTPIDTWLDNDPEVIGHVRNMDDIDIVVADKHTAKRIAAELTERCAERKLVIKPDVRIAPVRCGIDALGFVTYPTHVRIRRRMKENMRRKSAKLIKRGVSGKVYKQAMASHYGWCLHANARHLLQKIMGKNLQLFNMEIKRRKDLKPLRKFFGLDRDRFVSVTTLDNTEVLILEVMDVTIRGVQKIAVKFCIVAELDGENPSEQQIAEKAHYTITKSVVLRDRLKNDADIIPFAATIKKVKDKYWCYE